MKDNRSFWKNYIASVQLDLSVAAYTKVPAGWNDDDYVPDFNKLYFIREGEGYVKVGDRTFYPEPGQLVLLPAATRQSYGTVGPNRFGKYWCHFTAAIGNFPFFQVVEAPAVVDVREPERLQEKFEQLIDWSRRDELTSVLHQRSLLLEILAAFLDFGGESVKIRTNLNDSLDKINAVLSYIDEHLTEPLSVESLAQRAHFHPNYFIRLFKETTGLSPIQYINRLRMEKAKHFLSLTSWSVSRIAETLGLELSYFSRMFKEHVGMTPTEYRDWLQ